MLGAQRCVRAGAGLDTQPQGTSDVDDPCRRAGQPAVTGYERDPRVIPNSTPHRTPRTRDVRRSLAALGAVAAVAAGMAVASPSAQAADPTASTVERGQRPGEPGARLRGRLGRVRRARTVARGRVVRADALGLQPGAQHVGRLRADAPRRREPRLSSRGQGPGRRAGSARRRPLADTLGRAAGLTGLPEDALRTDERANIRGGAALLAATQQRLGLPTGAGTDAGQWYAAVADASGSAEQDVAAAFADDAYSVIASGASRRTVDGKEVSLVPSSGHAAGRPARPTRPAQEAERRPGRLPARTRLRVGPGAVPGPRRRGDYGNHDLANRPAAPEDHEHRHPQHRGELGHDPQARDRPDLPRAGTTRCARSDGHIAQHLDAKDVGWHAGNWYVNRPLDRPRARGLRRRPVRSGSASRCTARRRAGALPRRRSTTSRWTCSTSSATTRSRA